MNAAAELLTLWERAASALPPDRDDALLAVLQDEAPSSLGARNAALLRLRSQMFGRAQLLRCNCPHCTAVSEFAVDCEALSQSLLPAEGAQLDQCVELDGYRVDFRLPEAADLREAAARSDDDAAFERALIERCIHGCERDGAACAVEALPLAVTDAVSRRMEALEPGASVGFDLTCPECAGTWNAPMDVGAVLWSELQTRAERLLFDVDTLARAYGWSEAQVLALSPVRRAAYLQLVGAIR